MPELPEVESLRLGLNKYIVGQTIKRVTVTKPKLVSGTGNVRVASASKTKEFITSLQNQKITSMTRRAKNLMIHFASGHVLLIHLKMSGQLVYVEHGKNKVVGGHPIELSELQLPNKHSHIIFALSRGTLFYNDTRMFGYALVYPSMDALEQTKHFADVGLEPFDEAMTPEYLYTALHRRSIKIKTAFLEQRAVVGLGNIYADEVCFEAGVRPTRQTFTITHAEAKKLHAAIRRILKRAIQLGGSSIASYRLADGSRGNYAREHKVYGRGGKPCLVCGTTLTITQVNTRTTVYCRTCQK